MTDSGAIKSFTITKFHDFARSSGVRFSHDEVSEVQDITEASRYIVEVPPFWTRDDLLALKDFLQEQPV